MSQCTRCSVLANLVQKQQIEIQRLRQIISETKGACSVIISDSDKVFRSNQPRGTWSYAKGAKETAQKIERYLR